jgi:Protein of unknown function (DUF1656)
MYKEVNFCGIYLAPFFVCLLLTGIIYMPVNWLLDRLQIQRWVWNRPVFDAALFIIILCLITFIL